MSIGMKWALGGIAAALLVLATWSIAADSAPPPSNQVVIPSVPAAAAGALADARPTDGERTEPRPVAVAVDAIDKPAATTIRGRCVDEFGKPLAGCSLWLHGDADDQHELETWVRNHYDPQWVNPEPVTTGADGRFEWQFVPHEPLRFQCAMGHPGRVTMSCAWPSRLQGEGLQPGTTVELGDVALRGGAMLRGRVVDTAGQPVAGTKVYAYIPHEPNAVEAPAPNRNISADTDAAGVFASAQPLPFGNCQLSVYEREFRDGKRQFSFEIDSASPWVELVVVPREPHPTIRGIVVDDTGAPVPWPYVRAREPRRVHVADCEQDGTFEIEAREPSPAEIESLSVSTDGHEEAERKGPIAWGTTDLRIVLRRSVEGELRVVDPEGRPVDEFAAWLLYDDFPRVPSTTSWSTFGRHAGGTVRVASARRGPHHLLVEPRRRDLEMTTFTPVVVPDTGPLRFDVQLPRRAERLVRLVGSDGNPVPGSTVELIEAAIGELRESTKALTIEEFFQSSPYELKALVRSRSTTDSAGEVRLHGPTGSRFAVHVPGPVNLPRFVPDVLLDAPEPLVITVQRGTSLRVQFTPPGIGNVLADYASRDGRAASPAEEQRPQLWLRRSATGTGEPEPRCVSLFSAEDRAEFPSVEPGTWHLVLCFMHALGRTHMTQSWLHLGTVELSDTAGSQRILDLSHLLPATLEATVLHNGAPFADASFRFSGDFGDTGCGFQAVAWIDGLTDPSGRATIKVRPGTYTVRWPFTAEERIAVPAGSHVAQTFAMRSGTIRLTLRDAAGQPAANCAVLAKNGAGELVGQGSTDAQGRVDLLVPIGSLQLSWLPTTLGVLEDLPNVSLGSVVVGQGEVVNVERTLPPSTAR